MLVYNRCMNIKRLIWAVVVLILGIAFGFLALAIHA